MTVETSTSVAEGIRLLAAHGGVVEVRILKTAKGTVSGYFDNLDTLGQAVRPWDGRQSIYVTLNPVAPALLARANNRLKEYVRETSSDKDILRRVWFPVDLDPARPAGISSTEVELSRAIERRNELVAFVGELGFPEPVTAMSGNGAHALWAVDLPNDEASTKLFERALKALKVKFSDEVVTVDEAVFNAARIWKVYGTWAIKGDATADRPHRRATVERAPTAPLLLSRELLATLAAMGPAAAPAAGERSNGRRALDPLDLVEAFTARGLYLRPLRDRKHAVRCPWSDTHSGESGLTETCLFEPAAVGEPWGFDCKHAHCADRTIRDVLAVLQLVGTPRNGASRLAPSTREEPDRAAAVAVDVVAPYQFAAAFPRGHFVHAFIEYASGRTDAAHDYHEAAALILLASATPNVRAPLAQYTDGLPTNLYVLAVGDSTSSRKSTAKNIARDLQYRVIPDSLLADQSSPEAFIEQLASRSGGPSTWFVDEMGEMIEKLHHAKYMAGLRGLLLQAYDGGAYHYQRSTKRSKVGTPIPDVLLVERMHLSILGAATPAVFETLTGRDVETGFLGRFSVVMPTSKPPRRPFFEMGEEASGARSALTKWLHDLSVWAKSTPRPVTFSPGTLACLDNFAARLEGVAETADDRAKAMLQRLSAMTIKLSMLSAAGQPDAVNRDGLHVTPADAACAVTVAERWQGYALVFAGRVGENEFERAVTRCLRHAQQLATKERDRIVSRRRIAKNAHLPKRVLDDVQATLVDRGHIRVETDESKSGPDSVRWRLAQ